MSGLKEVWRGILFGLGGLLALLVLFLLAWGASNWRDAPPMPAPLELSLGPPLKGSPMFFKIQGVMAPEGADPEVTGRAGFAALQAGQQPPEGAPRLAGLKGLPLLCQPPEDCVRHLQDTQKVADQMAPHAALAARCEAVAGDALYVEELPAHLSATTLIPPMQGLSQCGGLFKGLAVMAAQRGDRDAALKHLRTGIGLMTRVQQGGRWLISVMIANTGLRGQYQAVAAVSAMRPEWAADLAALLQPLAPEALDPRRWMLVEAASMRGTLDDALQNCGDSFGGLINLEWLGRMACKLHIGLLPEVTRQGIDRFWLQQIKDSARPVDERVDAAVARARAPKAEAGLSWRNTLGQVLVDVAQPDLDIYDLRVVDIDLHRTALATALAAQAQRVPVAERAAWLQAQPLPARIKGRLAWQAQGLVLEARPWMAELPGSTIHQAPIRLPVAAPA
jgi:hypothetical protein